MRDVVAHYYFGIKDPIVLETVRACVPDVLPRLREMLRRIDEKYGQP
jgi:uncharacterized protein with HEPN domain